MVKSRVVLKEALTAEALWFGLSLCLISVALGPLIFTFGPWQAGLRPVWVLTAGFTLCVAAFFLSSNRLALMRPQPLGLALAVLILLSSHYGAFAFGRAGLNSFWVPLLVCMAGLLFLPGRYWPRLFSLLLLTGVAAGISGFFWASQGRLLFSDDHSAFLYRLIQLKENFPFIPFYNPQWNGGVEAREFFPSGVLNIYFLFAPLIHLFDVPVIYNVVVVLLLFVVTPLSAWIGGRLYGLQWTGAAAAGLLSLFSSLLWYRWALVYGTLGFILAAALLPLNMGLISKLLDTGRPSWLSVGATVVSVTLMSFWALALVAVLPALAFLTLELRHRERRLRIGLLMTALIFVNSLWGAVFVQSSKVIDFLRVESHQSAAEPEALTSAALHNKGLSPAKPLAALRQAAVCFYPLVVVFFIPGLLVLRRPVPYGLTAVWLLLLGTVFADYKPGLELGRMLVALAQLAALACGASLEHVFLFQNGGADGRALRRLAAGLPAGLLMLIPLAVYRIAGNQAAERFHFAEPVLYELSDVLQRLKGGGRIMFAGFVLHELSNGHLAPLPSFAKKPLMASRYQHDCWRYTDIIPERMRKRGEAGVLEFLNLYNVQYIITHDRFWRRWYEKRAELFEVVQKVGRFSIFRWKGFHDTYFLKGRGELLLQDGNSVTLKVVAQPAVVKFNYFAFLQCSACEMSPYPAADGVTFIELRNCRASEVTISAKPPWQRFWSIRFF